MTMTSNSSRVARACRTGASGEVRGFPRAARQKGDVLRVPSRRVSSALAAPLAGLSSRVSSASRIRSSTRRSAVAAGGVFAGSGEDGIGRDRDGWMTASAYGRPDTSLRALHRLLACEARHSRRLFALRTGVAGVGGGGHGRCARSEADAQTGREGIPQQIASRHASRAIGAIRFNTGGMRRTI